MRDHKNQVSSQLTLVFMVDGQMEQERLFAHRVNRLKHFFGMAFQGPKKPQLSGLISVMAERTGFEPATPGVTGRYSNQLNYRSAIPFG